MIMPRHCKTQPGTKKANSQSPKTKWYVPKLTDVSYMTIIDACSGYCSLKPNKKFSCLTTFACQIGRYRFTRLPFGVLPEGDVLQQKINESFKDLPNVFGIADDILIVGYDTDSKDHNRTLRHIMQMSC